MSMDGNEWNTVEKVMKNIIINYYSSSKRNSAGRR
jgi:hypothetical protein